MSITDITASSGPTRPGDVLGEATIGEFAQTLRGRLILPEDPGYDEARSIWNAAHDRHPALIVQAAGVSDVLQTVDLARSEGVALAVRGGGHSIPGFSTCDDGIVLDLSRMGGVRVDPARRRAVAQAGCTWRDLDAETQQFGLAVTGGLISTTGIGGFTLGGGVGWLVRRFGLTCDNLAGADVVTADGRLVHTSADEEPDLFWALRGGGGNFGVVTAFELDLHEVGSPVYSGLVFYPADEAEQVLRGYREACRDAPDELTTLVNMTTAPPVPFLPESVHGTPVVAVGGMWSGAVEDGEETTRRFRTLGTVIADVFSPHAYTAMQQALDPLYGRGMHNYFRSAFLRGLDDASVRALLSAYSALPNGATELHVHHLGGAMGRVAADATAFAVRDHEYIVNVIGRTTTAEGFDDVVAWCRDVTDGLAPDAPAYVNFTGEGSHDRVQAAYPPATYRRLVAVKDRYDPANLFRLNQNIPPSR